MKKNFKMAQEQEIFEKLSKSVLTPPFLNLMCGLIVGKIEFWLNWTGFFGEIELLFWQKGMLIVA